MSAIPESSAARCALLFGIPVNRQEFDWASTRNPRSDYMSKMLAQAAAESVWTSDYERIASAAQRLIETARELGAGVYQRTTLADFADATANYQYVVLFAHWRGVSFRVQDFSAPVEAIFERMHDNPLFRRVTDRWDVQTLVDGLNQAVQNLALLDSLPESIAEAGRRAPTIGQTISRDLIDESLAGLVAPGNRVELFDGLHTPAEIETALWADFSGELDLALCNSESLATFIDLRRRNTIRHLHWATVLHPLPQLLKIEKTLQHMARRGGDYIATRLSLEQAEGAAR